jgi:hypothetical protein
VAEKVGWKKLFKGWTVLNEIWGGKWAGRLRAESTRERVDGGMLEQEGNLGPGNPRQQRSGTVGETRYDPSCRIDLQGI